MNFDEELLAKANASGTWADFSDEDVIAKSSERMNLMKSGSKKDLSKLVPVQKQITRNGKQITQTVWVKPGGDEEKEAKQSNDKQDNKKKKDGGIDDKTKGQLSAVSEALKTLTEHQMVKDSLADMKDAWGYNEADVTNMYMDMATKMAADSSLSKEDAYTKVKGDHPDASKHVEELGDDPNRLSLESVIEMWEESSEGIEDQVETDEDEELLEVIDEQIDSLIETLEPFRARFK